MVASSELVVASLSLTELGTAQPQLVFLTIIIIAKLNPGSQFRAYISIFTRGKANPNRRDQLLDFVSTSCRKVYSRNSNLKHIYDKYDN